MRTSRRASSGGTATIAAALLLIPALIVPGVAGAEQKREDWQAGPWMYHVGLYLYLPTISGLTQFPGGAGGPGVEVDPSKILGSLKFAVMGTLEAENGRWGIATDLIYLNVGGSKSGTRDFTIGGTPIPADASANAHLDLKSWVWTIAPEYRVVSVPAFTMDLLLGARLLSVDEVLTWQVTGNVGPIPAPGRSGSSEASDTFWDGILGVKGRAAFGESRRWFVPYYFDVGTGESRLTWQAAGGLGYAFRWGSLQAGWRHLAYEMKSDSHVEKLTLSGPMLLAVYRW